MILRNRLAFSIVVILVFVSNVLGLEKSDKSQNAVILLDETEFHIINGNKGKLKKHRIVQVNNSAGKEYGHISVHETQFIKAGKMTGSISDINGDLIKKLEKDDIQKSDYCPGDILYQDLRYFWAELSLANFPYLVEYTYEQDYLNLYFWPDWLPQEKVPVLKASFKLILNEKSNYRMYSIGIDIKPEETIEAGKNVLTWTLENIEPQIDEKYMPSEHEIQMALFFTPGSFQMGNYQGSTKSWNDYAAWCYRLFSGKYELPPEAIEQVGQVIAGQHTDRAKVQHLYTFLQKFTRYVAIELGPGGMEPHSASFVYNNRYGDCKDLSTFMIAMLKVAGITAYPVLVSTKRNIIREFPSDQFNHVITMVPLQQDTIWLECTADYLAAGQLSAAIEGKDVLVIKKNGGDLVRIPQQNYNNNKWLSKIEGKLTASGKLDFFGTITGTGHKGQYLRDELNYIKPEERKRWLAGRLGYYLPKLDLLEYEFENIDQNLDQPVVIRFKGTVEKFANRSASRMFINPNILHRDNADDIPRDLERIFPIQYRYRYLDLDSLVLTLPDGFELEAAINATEISRPFGSFSTNHAIKDGKFFYSRMMSWTQQSVAVSEYSEYLEYLKAAVKNDKSQFVFVKR